MQKQHKAYLVSSFLTICFLFVGIKTYAWATDGWQAWTAESARRVEIEKIQPELPNIDVVNQNGIDKKLHAYPEDIYIVDFIFTGCTTICTTLGYRLQQMQTLLSNYQKNIRFISISFDHANDSPKKLNKYLKRYSTDQNNWDALVVRNEIELKNLLDMLGVVVIPDEKLGFIHNTAIYIVYDKRVTNIHDYNDYEMIAEKIINNLDGEST